MRSANMVVAVAAMLLAGCHNGSNNARDTTGMPNTSAAGSMGASGTGAAGAIPTDTTHRDTVRKKP